MNRTCQQGIRKEKILTHGAIITFNVTLLFAEAYVTQIKYYSSRYPYPYKAVLWLRYILVKIRIWIERRTQFQRHLKLFKTVVPGIF
jgi:hypothetical protein